jgi:hypothetical protein
MFRHACRIFASGDGVRFQYPPLGSVPLEITMKNLYVLLLTFLFAGTSWAAISPEHPADAAANVPTFLPADFLAQSQAEMTVEEPVHQHGEAVPQQAEPEAQSAHDHDHAAAAEDAAPESKTADGKGCKRGGGCCCCCKCCKGEEETKAPDMPSCKMMKKGGMMMDKGKSGTSKKSVAKPAAKKEDAHEAHH